MSDRCEFSITLTSVPSGRIILHDSAPWGHSSLHADTRRARRRRRSRAEDRVYSLTLSFHACSSSVCASGV
jgi:hypothetical protein